MAAALFPIHDDDKPQLVGIARLAAQGEHVRDGHNVEYFTLPVRSLLNKCSSPRMPFTWTVNPYRGCEFACKYCYARYTHEFMELRDGRDFERKIYIKQQAGWLLRRDLRRVKKGESIAIGTATDPYQPAERRAEITRAVLEELALHRGLDIGIVTKSNLVLRDGRDFERKIYIKQQAAWLLRRDLQRVKKGESIAIGTATDPYQPAERRAEITRAVLEELALHRGLDIGIVTKSNLVLRDAELLRRIAEQNQLFVNLTITTLDVELARILEPRAPRPDLRMEAMKQLNLAGVPAGVICAPVVPGITDAPKDLELLVKTAAENGARHIYANPLFLKPCSAAVFLPFLQEKFPHLVASYRRRFEGKAFLDQAYRKRISALMRKLRAKYGIAAREEADERAEETYEAAASETQLQLF